MKLNLKSFFFLTLTFLLFLVLTSTMLLSQGVTTAAINGVVTDKAGQGLPGANVVAVHNPSGTTYGTSTREDGSYTLPNLRVGGPYTLSVSYVGYKREEQKDITLQLSQTARFDFQLVEEAVQAAEVVVRAERSTVFNAARSGAASNVTRDQIERLPTISRSFTDYFKLSPLFVGNNAAGRNNRYNNIQIDGANFNDLFGLGGTGTPAGQSSGNAAVPISLDAIEEFQIVISPYDVRQAGFTGAGINAITRSGTNNFRGSAFYYGRNQDLVGKFPSYVDSQKTKLDKFTDYQMGFRVGGPVIENQLFFFANGEIARRKQPLTRTFGNATGGTNQFRVPVDSLNLLTNFLKTRYGYDPGPWDALNTLTESDKLFLRFDYNLSESHKLTARWNYFTSIDDNSPSRGRGATDIYSDNGKYKLLDKTNSFAVQLTSVFGNSASNEFILGYVNQFDNPVYYGGAFPTLYIRTTGGAEQLVTGSEEFRHGNELEQSYFEITNNFSLYMGSHTLTAGAKVDMFKFRNLFLPDYFGAYTYASIGAFIADTAGGVGAPTAYSFRYPVDPNNKEANWGARQFGFYLQDEWMVSPTLKFTAGVRFDIPTYPDKPTYNFRADSVFGIKTNETPKSSVAISPRFGFNWALDEERNSQLRGGVGIFYGRFPYVWVSNQYSNTGVDFITVSTAPAAFVPNTNQGGTGSITTAEVDITDPNFKAPSIIRMDLGLDHRVTSEVSASLEGILSLSQNEVYYQNILLAGLQNNTLTPNGRVIGENREVWGTVNAATGQYSTRPVRVSTLFTPGVYLVKNTDKGYNANIIAQLQRQSPTDGFYANLAYTWGLAKDIGGVNSTTARSGWRFNPTQGNPNDPQLSWSDADRRHRILATVSYRYEWGEGLATTFGLFYNGVAGRPFSYVVNGDINGDGETDNDLVYIPKDANDILLVASAGGAVLPTTDSRYAVLMQFIEDDDYLREHKGQIMERNGAREPWYHQLDLRITQEIPVIMGHRVELSFDFLNFTNFLNSDWGWQRSVAQQNTFLMQFDRFEAAAGANQGRPKYISQVPSGPSLPGNISSRWQAQFGVRYTF